MGRAEERVIATGIRDIWGGRRLGEGKYGAGTSGHSVAL